MSLKDSVLRGSESGCPSLNRLAGEFRDRGVSEPFRGRTFSGDGRSFPNGNQGGMH
jgi:hypothetical protein